ncbi:recombinase family protein [bacterium]|nr:recombinase family protein [bacterium]
MEQTTNTPLTYCLYARKSSESDEKQAMSIDGQLREMSDLAKRDKINVIEVITESHSAKETGQRPQFNHMLENINKGKYNAIITWAPDRISRNAGDLGRVVDLMDQGKLALIKTHSQTFSNNPNEKFLLMILCSQAKLENDNRGINVKRGLRNKCEVGIRPSLAPLGYINQLKANRISEVVPEPVKATIIKQMFQYVAEKGMSGRAVRKWLSMVGFKSKSGKDLSLSRIYETLKNPFYYGEFKFGNKWYKGTHEPLINKQTYDKVQIQLQTTPKQWNKQVYPFKKICKCWSCGGSITAEMKYRVTKNGEVHPHLYYHCNRIKDYNCQEPYITEQELIKQLIALLPQIKLDMQYLWNLFQNEIKRLNHLKAIMNNKVDTLIVSSPHKSKEGGIKVISIREAEMIKDYFLHILQYGAPEERQNVLTGVETLFLLKERSLIIAN